MQLARIFIANNSTAAADFQRHVARARKSEQFAKGTDAKSVPFLHGGAGDALCYPRSPGARDRGHPAAGLLHFFGNDEQHFNPDSLTILRGGPELPLLKRVEDELRA